MTWPTWLSGPESFGLGLIAGAFVTAQLVVWLLDTRRIR